FFKAEEGMRDGSVTGVQTCALPIYELNHAGAKLAREAAAIAEKEDGRRRFVAGAIGPTNRTASISPDVNRPGFRAITFDELKTEIGKASCRGRRERWGVTAS